MYIKGKDGFVRNKDLQAYLASQDPEALIFIADGHEGVNQVNATAGFVSEEEVKDYCYVNEKSEERTIPAIRIDTGC